MRLQIMCFVLTVFCQTTLFALCPGCNSRGEDILEFTGIGAAGGIGGIGGIGGCNCPGKGDYALIWNDIPGDEMILPNADVSFNNNSTPFSPCGGTVSHDPTVNNTQVIINSPGTYLARYILTLGKTGGSDVSTFELALNGLTVPGSDRASYTPPSPGVGTLYGDGIFIAQVGDVLTVRNAGAGGPGLLSTLTTEPPSSVKASLFITKLCP